MQASKHLYMTNEANYGSNQDHEQVRYEVNHTSVIEPDALGSALDLDPKTLKFGYLQIDNEWTGKMIWELKNG